MLGLLYFFGVGVLLWIEAYENDSYEGEPFFLSFEVSTILLGLAWFVLFDVYHLRTWGSGGPYAPPFSLVKELHFMMRFLIGLLGVGFIGQGVRLNHYLWNSAKVLVTIAAFFLPFAAEVVCYNRFIYIAVSLISLLLTMVIRRIHPDNTGFKLENLKDLLYVSIIDIITMLIVLAIMIALSPEVLEVITRILSLL